MVHGIVSQCFGMTIDQPYNQQHFRIVLHQVLLRYKIDANSNYNHCNRILVLLTRWLYRTRHVPIGARVAQFHDNTTHLLDSQTHAENLYANV
jgi:hypothetical protein